MFAPETRSRDETWVKPVRKLPVDDLVGKVAGTQVRLSSGRLVWAMIGNVDVHNAKATEHFISLSFRLGRTWFHLARYHDFDYESHGPKALADALQMPINDVFPIAYDLTHVSRGDPQILRGRILSAPRKRLSEAALMRLSLD